MWNVALSMLVAGEITALLGHNGNLPPNTHTNTHTHTHHNTIQNKFCSSGAGKTTAINLLTGMLTPSGSRFVCVLCVCVRVCVCVRESVCVSFSYGLFSMCVFLCKRLVGGDAMMFGKSITNNMDAIRKMAIFLPLLFTSLLLSSLHTFP